MTGRIAALDEMQLRNRGFPSLELGSEGKQGTCAVVDAPFAFDVFDRKGQVTEFDRAIPLTSTWSWSRTARSMVTSKSSSTDPPSIDPSMWSPSEGCNEDGSSRTDVAHASALSPSEANRWASSVRERTPSLR